LGFQIIFTRILQARAGEGAGARAGAGAVLGLALVGLLWGLNWPAVKFMMTEIPPLTIRAVAFPLAALLLALITRVMGHPLGVPRDERLPLLVTGVFLIFGFNILTSLGQVLVETSKAAIIAYIMPALTAVLAAVFLGERIGRPVVIALLIGMAGLAVLASENFAALAAAPLGPAIMAGAALSWALGNVAVKMRRWRTPPLVMSVWFFVVSSLLIWPLVLVFEPLSAQHWPGAPVLWTFVYHVLGPMVVCYLLWTILLGRLPATVAAIALLTAPVVGVLSSVLLLGDTLTWQKLLSLLMIILSIAMTLAPQWKRPAPVRDGA
jgi:drug/metabolite transporter (DMT)-like permease